MTLAMFLLVCGCAEDPGLTKPIKLPQMYQRQLKARWPVPWIRSTDPAGYFDDRQLLDFYTAISGVVNIVSTVHGMSNPG